MVKPSEEQASYSTALAAKKLGISTHTLRRYEKKGLIRPFRDLVSGRSLFSDRDLTLVRNIRKLIHREGLNIASIQRLLAIIPCWKIKDCPETKKAKCPVLTDKTSPCWAIAQDGCIKEVNKCRACRVYLIAEKRLS